MSRKRMSRGLVAGVGVVIVLGAVAVLHKSNKSNAEAKGGGGGTMAVAPVSVVAPVAPVAPVKAAEPAPAVKSTGQIALPGSAKTLVTQTPGGAESAKTPAVPVTPAVAPATEVKPGPVVKAPVAAAVETVKAPVKAPALAAVTPAATVTKSGNPLVEGKALIDTGSLVAGRQILNDALVGGELNEADAQKAKEMIAAANETLVFSPRRFSDDPYMGSYTVQPGNRPGKIASSCDVTWDFLGRINGISDAKRIRAGQTIKTVKGPFHAVVSKSKFTMDMYLGSPGEKGSMYVRTFPVGLGKQGSTPKGTWMVAPQSKLKNPKWWGTPDEPAREAGDPLNPLGKFWLGLHGTDGEAVGKEGFGIHGTVDPASIGKEMSHGCIRLVNENVERVYEMLIDGKSTIIVKD